jgi:3'-phosphoadenosine 5'-phosphosulfate sulfotransferase (PAPS reductase)/FAD synthetase
MSTAQQSLFAGRTLVWFSCGVSSAVAAKIACEQLPEPIEVLYHDLSADEHPDNMRFLADCERWIGRPIRKLKPMYRCIEDVFHTMRFIVSPKGAPCTRVMKRNPGLAYSGRDDVNVFGMTADESDRITRFDSRREVKAAWLLRDAGITKRDCFRIVQAAGIELPAMYHLGYKNNNCIGCVKGGMGYWNKIRRDFPIVFARRAALERELGYPICRKVYLDELPTDAGRYEAEPDISCGPVCQMDATP